MLISKSSTGEDSWFSSVAYYDLLFNLWLTLPEQRTSVTEKYWYLKRSKWLTNWRFSYVFPRPRTVGRIKLYQNHPIKPKHPAGLHKIVNDPVIYFRKLSHYRDKGSTILTGLVVRNLYLQDPKIYLQNDGGLLKRALKGDTLLDRVKEGDWIDYPEELYQLFQYTKVLLPRFYTEMFNIK